MRRRCRCRCHPLPAWTCVRARRERDRLYERAEAVADLLAHLGDQLKGAISDVNDSTGALRPAAAAEGTTVRNLPQPERQPTPLLPSP